ncbi:phosphoacetylglucosamine mutase [Naematelia encephala]|uniref:Phosphoacetylglucosamine mutase n=1 Tax=Naematelia encephala TaxID=71784 RepID=A0A1Y2BK07_9TREE|nr:phosphoacetylglucosamine mutase [Naematelia encephala]
MATTEASEHAHKYATLLDSLQDAANLYPKPEGLKYSYGTAGFRTLANLLPPVMFRVGLLAILRSKRLAGATIGVMVTASHNPEQDNGVKLVDPSGEMLEPLWELHATTLANCPSTASLLSTFMTLVSHLRVDLDQPANIVYARDTRPSSPGLVEALEAAFRAFSDGAKVVDLGITTTPILHYVVKATNDKSGESGIPTQEGYMKRMAKAFKTLIGNRGPLAPLHVDCANGVGAFALEEFSKHIGDLLPFRPINTDVKTRGALNFQCGADFVKTKQALPPSVAQSGVLSKPDTRGCSFDGDADRLVYYYLRDGKTFRLLDGDKIAGLVAMYIKDLVGRARMHENNEPLKIGVVQTAYANGSSTKYLKSRNIPVRCVPTGVKHLHHAAQLFDIGVYFEANGHGTVLFSPSCLTTLREFQPDSPESANAIKQLIALSELINQAVGDALSDMLLVEVVLAYRGWGAEEWDAGYEDLPNRLVKVEVHDRSQFVTIDAERKLQYPTGLQDHIDDAVNKFELGRSFVRPSGTEDCVRLYAEAKSTADVESLTTMVTDLLTYYGGP